MRGGKVTRGLRGCLWREGVNGLGVLGFHALPYRRRFDRAARRHDADYDKRGGALCRKWCDKAFLVRMLEASDTYPQCAVAFFYFTIVRLLGWAFYRYDR